MEYNGETKELQKKLVVANLDQNRFYIVCSMNWIHSPKKMNLSGLALNTKKKFFLGNTKLK